MGIDFFKTRFLKISEQNILKNFIKKNYKKNHVIVKSTKLLNFFFLNKKRKKLNFVASFLNKEIVSIYGVLNNKHWDKNLNSDMQLSLWINKKKNFVSGFETFKYILNVLKPYSLFTSGLNLDTSGRIFSIFAEIKKYDHFYICNPTIKKKISQNLISEKKTRKINSGKFKIFKTSKPLSLPKYDFYPKKSIKFFLNKYTKNPFYKYFFLNFKLNKKIKFFFVCREIYVEKFNSKIMRIVDFYGNFPNKKSLKTILSNYLIKNELEYLDFVVYGLNKKKIKNIGFEIKQNGQIIPNYFEPFIKKNVDLNLAIITNPYKNRLVSVKADSDQERPNRI